MVLRAGRPDPDVYLYWQLTLEEGGEGPLDVHLVGDDGTDRWLAGDSPLALPWLHADTTYTVHATQEGYVGEVTFTTLPLPEPFPIFEVLHHQPDRIGPGLTVVPASHPDHGLIIILDEGLQPVWVAVSSNPWYTVEWSDDRFVGMRGHDIRRVTLDGVWSRDNAERRLHHDVVDLGADGSLTLAEEVVEVDAYPRGVDRCDELGTQTLLDHQVVHYAADGSEQRVLSMVDVLQTTRCAYDGFVRIDGGLDWAHLNAVLPTSDDQLILSSRTQSAVFRTDWSGELTWILSDPAGWVSPWSDALLTPVGEVTWPEDQHSPHFDEATQTLTVFDNGGRRYTPYDEPPATSGEYSRVVAYQIDGAQRTVSEAWSWQPTPSLYASIMGDADPLPNGHVLSAWTWLDGDATQTAEALGWGDRATRVIEFVPGEPTPLLDLRLRSDRDDLDLGWWTFRVQRTTRAEMEGR